MPYRLLVHPLARAASRATGRLGYLRGALGGALGIALALLAAHLLPPGWQGALLVAPVGASAVLVLALPASPLAQPWPVFGGSLLAMLVGLLVHGLVPAPALAAPLALGLALVAMSLARCLHPPGGACALIGALGNPAMLPLLAVNLAGLLVAGWLWNNATGHRYPHRAAPAPAGPARYSPADLDAVLEEWDEVLDVSREDLDALFRAVEARVITRG